MTFQSLEYLIFLPVVFILYWTVCRGSKTLQNGLIVAASPKKVNAQRLPE